MGQACDFCESIASGDGYVETTVSETNTYRMIGLSHGDSDQNYNDIDFAIYPIVGGGIQVYEGGTYRGSFGSYTSGDVLRVAVEGGVVTYRKNGTLLYTSTVAPAYPLLVDSSLYSNGSTLTNVVISGASGSGSSAQIRWLVTDQLGTPRMIFDQTGALANMSRHDYLPFGEELFGGPPNLPGTGGRLTTQGYSASDNVRQRFTQKERDNETGLDYFLARYYSSAQGRFTSPDEFKGGPEELFEDVDPHDPLFYADIAEPQSLNKYHYCLNNPLRYIDPDGHQTTTSDRLKQAAATTADFGGGVVKGVVSSFTFGLMGGPDARDSRANRAGQVVGTVVEGVAGLVVAGPGSGAVTLGSDGVAAVTGVSEATVVAGATMTIGSVVNLAKIATTPMQRNTSGDSSSSNEPSSKKSKVEPSDTSRSLGGGKFTEKKNNQTR